MVDVIKDMVASTLSVLTDCVFAKLYCAKAGATQRIHLKEDHKTFGDITQHMIPKLNEMMCETDM